MRRRSRGRRRSVDRGTRRPAIELRNQPLRGADAVRNYPKTPLDPLFFRTWTPFSDSYLVEAEGYTEGGATGKPSPDPAQSETLCTHGNSSHGKREIPRVPIVDGTADRPEKVTNRNPGMYARGKSDGRVIPGKPPNNDGDDPPAEAVEGRRPTEGNTLPEAASRTQSRLDAWIALQRVREVARRDRRARFTALLHHVTVDLLRESFYALKRHAAPGIDGLT